MNRRKVKGLAYSPASSPPRKARNPADFAEGTRVVDVFTGQVYIVGKCGDWWVEMKRAGKANEHLPAERLNGLNNPRFEAMP